MTRSELRDAKRVAQAEEWGRRTARWYAVWTALPWLLGAAGVLVAGRWVAGAEVRSPGVSRPGWLRWPDLSWPPAWVLALLALVAVGWLGAALWGRLRRGYPLGRSWLRPFR